MPMDETLMHLILVLGKMSLLAFGGLNTVLSDMQREVVAQGWMTSSQFAEAFAFSQLTPGPSISYLVIPIGYAAAGPLGATVALVAATTPAALVALAVSRVWGRLRESAWACAGRIALAPLAIGLILASTLTLGREIVRDGQTLLLVLGTAALLLRSPLPTPAIVLGATICGALFLRP